jgi:2-C-methyl-D-erythritol 4-phosphate cytidylyltransferase
MNSAVPKQFMLLCGKPIVIRTMEAFRAAIPDIQIIVVLAKDLQEEFVELNKMYLMDKNTRLTIGGETRFHSVKNGLALVPEDAIVGIHDAARPLVSEKTIVSCFANAEQKGNAIPCISITESIRMLEGESNKAVDRNKFVIAQTPQCFISNEIHKAFEQDYSPLFTDDASVYEANGGKIHLVEGNKENIKITTPSDLLIAEMLLKSSDTFNLS